MPRESKRAKRERTGRILTLLAEMYPESRCSLEHEDAFQLAVATVLSAQCTDARVNMVTPALFARYPTPAALAEAPQEDVEELIRSTGFFRSKAKSLLGLAQALEDRFGGEVPRSIEDLTSLPGVGRKTANVVRGVAYGLAEGVVVDTHVKRIANRLRLTKHEDPERIEKDLIELIPEEERVIFTHRVIDHGRAICVARRPRCEVCLLLEECPEGQKRVG
ncbi:MAG: endonuclease III [Gemmatimonadota bacterium]